MFAAMHAWCSLCPSGPDLVYLCRHRCRPRHLDLVPAPETPRYTVHVEQNTLKAEQDMTAVMETTDEFRKREAEKAMEAAKGFTWEDFKGYVCTRRNALVSGMGVLAWEGEKGLGGKSQHERTTGSCRLRPVSYEQQMHAWFCTWGGNGYW